MLYYPQPFQLPDLSLDQDLPGVCDQNVLTKNMNNTLNILVFFLLYRNLTDRQFPCHEIDCFSSIFIYNGK